MDELTVRKRELADCIKYHLGLPIIIDENAKEDELKIDIGMHGLGRNLVSLIDKVLECMEEEEINCNSTYEMKNYFSKILTKLLFGKGVEDDSVFRFIGNINKLSKMTYENEKIETGIYVADVEVIEKFCEKNKWKLIRGSKEDFEEIIYRNKPMRKLVNNKEYAYCFDKNLEYIGIISNCDISQSIIDKMNTLQENDLKTSIVEQIVDICEYLVVNFKKMMFECDETNKFSASDAEKIIDTMVEMYHPYNIKDVEDEIQNILYIEISNNRVQYYVNPYTYIEEVNGEWRLYEYLSLVAPLVAQILNAVFFMYEQDDYEYAIEVIYKLVLVIKKMSIHNRGALIVLCNENSAIDDILAPYKKLNFKRLFGDIEKVEILDLSNEKLMNLLCVDGATIINSQMELIDFGRILKNEVRDGNEYGARTNAAISASYYGLAIKISEDGDVTLFRNGNVCKRYEQF